MEKSTLITDKIKTRKTQIFQIFLTFSLGIFLGILLGISFAWIIFSCLKHEKIQETTLTRAMRDLLNISISVNKCDLGWTHFAGTNACYYYQNFTYDDNEEMVKFTWNQAEKNCQKYAAHLTSINSRIELDFLKELTQTNLKSSNSTSDNVCYNSAFYAWVGLYKRNGKRQFVDGSIDDARTPNVPDDVEYAICSDHSNKLTNQLFYLHDKPKNARYVCKKAIKKFQ